MNVGVELSVELTGLQKAVRQSPLSAGIYCCIHMNFLCGIFCILSSFYPLFITNVGVCMSVSCIYWLRFCDVSVCLLLCEGPISMWLYACCLSLFQRCRLLLSSCFSAAIETLVAPPLQPRYHISCSRFPQWLRTGLLSSSNTISSPCRLQAVVQQLDSQADESQQTAERVTFISSSVRNREISFNLIHVWLQLKCTRFTSV